MKKAIIAAAPLVVLAAAITGVLAVKASDGGGSSTAAAATSQQQDQTAWLGATVVLTPDGVTVSAVIADSPADKAGLQRADVIKSVDGTAVSEPPDLRDALNDKSPGDSVTLSITRDGDAQDITVTLEARPEALPYANSLFPELNGIPRDQLYSHMLGGSFQFTDQDGKQHTATVDLGTVSAVDTNAKTISVDLNAGGSKTYEISGDVRTFPQDLSQFESGDKVSVVSVDGDLRVVTKGPGRFLPFFEGKHGFGPDPGGRHGFRDHGEYGPPGRESGSGL